MSPCLAHLVGRWASGAAGPPEPLVEVPRQLLVQRAPEEEAHGPQAHPEAGQGVGQGHQGPPVRPPLALRRGQQGRQAQGHQAPGPGQVHVGHPAGEQGGQVGQQEEDHGLQGGVGGGGGGEGGGGEEADGHRAQQGQVHPGLGAHYGGGGSTVHCTQNLGD